MVTYSDCTDENGVRQNTIGAATNNLKDAYWSAIKQAESNGNELLAKALLENLNNICKESKYSLDAICDLQKRKI